MEVILLKKIEKTEKIKPEDLQVIWTSDETDEEEAVYSGLGVLSPSHNQIQVLQYGKIKAGENDEKSLEFTLAFRTGSEKEHLQNKNASKELDRIWNEKDGFWYFLPLVSTAQSGKLLYRMRNEDTKEEFDVSVHIFPVIGEDKFNAIIEDLQHISIQMLESQNHDRMHGVSQSYTAKQTELLQIEKRISEISEIIHALGGQPESDFVTVPVRMPFHRVKQITPEVILDHYVLKKNRVRSRAHVQSFDIYENRMILVYLKKLLRQLELLERAHENNDTMPLEEKGIGEKEFSVELKKTRGKLCDILGSPIFRQLRSTNETLHSSNLFINHKKYAKAFQCMNQYREISETIDTLPKYHSLKNASEIYEIWCFFKVLELLMVHFDYRIISYSKPSSMKDAFEPQWLNFSDEKETEQKGLQLAARIIRDYLKNSDMKSLYNLAFLLEKAGNSEDTIWLGYNTTIQVKQVKKYIVRSDGTRDREKQTTPDIRPDILLIKGNYLYTLDAKYHDYGQDSQGEEQWYVDLIECAAFKYLYRMEYNQKQWIPVCTAILHPGIDSGRISRVRQIESDAFETYKQYEYYLFKQEQYKMLKNGIVDPAEYRSEAFRKKFMPKPGQEKTEYDECLASTPFVPGNVKGLVGLLKRIASQEKTWI